MAGRVVVVSWSAHSETGVAFVTLIKLGTRI
jgi:hypothetical protein